MNESSGWPTTRRFPRTLAQAWPREHANPIEWYSRPSGWLRGVALAVCIGMALAVVGIRWAAGV